jgi:hypothetical protein
VGVADGTILTSPDGITWTSRDSPRGNDLNGIAFGNGYFVAVGTTGTILQSGPIINLSVTPNPSTRLLSLSLEGPGDLDYTIQTSTDLISWQDVTTIARSPSGKIVLDGLPMGSGNMFYRVLSE